MCANNLRNIYIYHLSIQYMVLPQMSKFTHNYISDYRWNSAYLCLRHTFLTQSRTTAGRPWCTMACFRGKSRRLKLPLRVSATMFLNFVEWIEPVSTTFQQSSECKMQCPKRLNLLIEHTQYLFLGALFRRAQRKTNSYVEYPRQLG